MKKITIILAGLALSAAAQANEMNQKFYAGVNVGGSFATLSKTVVKLEKMRASKFDKKPMSADLHFGKRFGAFGVELSAGYLDKIDFSSKGTNTLTAKAIDYLIALDLGYYMPVTDQISVRATVGVGGMYTKNTFTLTGITGQEVATGLESEGFTSKDDLLGYNITGVRALVAGANNNSQFKVAPKAGLGLVFAVNQNVSLTANTNVIYPIKADNVKYLINASIGANYHF